MTKRRELLSGMINAELSKQLMILVNNAVGSLAEVTSVVSSSGINLIALCAYEVEGKVAIMVVTADNNESKKLLEKQGFAVQEQEVILLTIANKPGALQRVTDLLAESGISLSLIYGSVDEKSESSRIIIIAEDNMDAMVIIKTLIERR